MMAIVRFSSPSPHKDKILGTGTAIWFNSCVDVLSLQGVWGRVISFFKFSKVLTINTSEWQHIFRRENNVQSSSQNLTTIRSRNIENLGFNFSQWCCVISDRTLKWTHRHHWTLRPLSWLPPAHPYVDHHYYWTEQLSGKRDWCEIYCTLFAALFIILRDSVLCCSVRF